MPNNKWDDDHIENLLRDFPAIKDERPKEEVYKRLLQEEVPQKKSKHWIPYLVAALAFITFGVLLASMLGQNGTGFDISSSERSEESADSGSIIGEEESVTESESAELESSGAADTESGSDIFNSMQGGADPTASIYPDELADSTLFTIGLTENAYVIPVSFTIGNDKLMADFGTADVDAASLYNRYAAEIDEQALGFDEYHPYSGSIEMAAEGIEHTVPEDHNYDMASAALTVYFNSMAVSFGEAEQFSVVDESGNPAEFDQIGPVEPVAPELREIAYYAYTSSNGSTYLMPGFDMSFENAAEALDAMKSTPADAFQSLIPDGVDYSVSETEQAVTVEFVETIDFDAYDYEDAMRMIEGLALSADSFGKELLLGNTVQDSWDRFDISNPLPVPAGINRIPFE